MHRDAMANINDGDTIVEYTTRCWNNGGLGMYADVERWAIIRVDQGGDGNQMGNPKCR